MENENQTSEQAEVVEQKTSPLHTITPFSKYIAMGLFIVLPFLGGWIGYTYAPEKVVEVEKIIIETTTPEITKQDEITTVEAAGFINGLGSVWPSIETNYMDIPEPPPWAYHSNGRLKEAARNIPSKLQTGVPSKACDFIQKQSDGSWLLTTDIDTEIPWLGQEDTWTTVAQYGDLQYLGFECTKYSIEFYFEGEITMRGTTYYPDCYGTCQWFNPNSEVAEQLSFIFDLSENKPTMASLDLDNIVTSAHLENGQRHTADLTLKTDRLNYGIKVVSNTVNEDGSPQSRLDRSINFPINGYQINNITKESF
jgi:hypothetical protein